MAVTMSICQTATNADCTEFTITDETGLYSVTNTGGYGTPNLDRADLALYLIGYKYEEGEEDSEITDLINNTDPENVTEWAIANTEDGYYYFNIMAIPVWDIAVTYAIDDLVFYQQVWYKTLIANLASEPTSVNTDWEVIADIGTEIDNEATESTVRYDFNYTCRVEICYAGIVHESGAVCNSCEDCTGKELQLYMKLDVLFQSMFIHMSQDNWAEADKVTRTITGYCSKTNCRVC